MHDHRLAGDPRCEGRATDAENVGPLILIHALALKSRVNPELCGIVCGRPRMYTPLRSR
jgi:hypothetical protein